MLLSLQDGGILNIDDSKEYFSGCETCDFGSSYINYFHIELTTMNINIEASESYEYPLSDNHIMKIILPNIGSIQKKNEEEFSEWLQKSLMKEVKNLEYRVIRKYR